MHLECLVNTPYIIIVIVVIIIIIIIIIITAIIIITIISLFILGYETTLKYLLFKMIILKI